MKKVKTMKCSYCHKTGHTQLTCYKKAWDIRLGRGKYKYALQGSESRSKGLLGSKTVKTPSRTKMSKTEQSERRKLIKELDRVTSLVVRLGSADKQGYCFCYTSGKRIPWNQLDAGHCFSRRHTNTRWDLDNIRPQSRYDNRILSGNYEVYLPKMRKELGEERYWALYRKAHSTRKVTTLEMRTQLEEMNARLKEIIRERQA